MTTMKLSEAIREGAKLHPQGFDAFYASGATCALGAAASGIGFDFTEYKQVRIHTFLFDNFHCLSEHVDSEKPIFDEIVEQNDGDRASREDIADWLEARGL